MFGRPRASKGNPTTTATHKHRGGGGASRIAAVQLSAFPRQKGFPDDRGGYRGPWALTGACSGTDNPQSKFSPKNSLPRICQSHVAAERRAGQFLAEMPKNTGAKGQLAGRDPSGDSIVRPPEAITPTLSDMGISKDQSYRRQKLGRTMLPRFRQPYPHGGVFTNPTWSIGGGAMLATPGR